MNLFDLFARITLDDEDYKKKLGENEGRTSAFADKLKTGLATAGKVAAAGLAAASTAAVALGKAAVDSYADYEQLVGGVETLFTTSADAVQKYAEVAYKTAGLSANEYMTTVTSFSASLLQSLGGDTAAAADYADQAIIDMADNANKMGSSMESIQNAYQGFAKQNFTMLDNLKLGYGGTKEEMQRLLDDAGKIAGIEFDISSFADITQAIHVMQEEMGIAGATAAEAEGTISGSLSAMKGAWKNLITGIADQNADLSGLITAFVDSASIAAENVVPKISVAMNGAAQLIRDMVPIIVQEIPTIIEQNLFVLTEAAVGIVQSLVDGIAQNQEALFTSVFDVITYLAETFITMLPQIVALGLELIVSLANGIAESLPELVPTIVDVILQIVNTLTDPKNLGTMVDASLAIITALAEGLLTSLPQLLAQAPIIVANLATSIVENIPKIIQSASQLLGGLITGIVNYLPTIGTAAGRIVTTIATSITNLRSKIKEVGTNIVSGVWTGINEKVEWFTDKVRGFFSGIVDGVRDVLGIHSPSRVFAGIGGFMAEGLGEGWDKQYDAVKKDIEGGLHFDAGTVDFAASAVGVSSAGIINGFASANREDGKAIEVVLKLPDNTELARYYLPSFIDVARSNGTPIANPL